MALFKHSDTLIHRGLDPVHDLVSEPEIHNWSEYVRRYL